MFYDIFSELCRERGVSPSAVMVAIGLNKSNATFWKKGSIPKGETLQKLAGYFGVSVDYLLDLSPEEQATLRYVEDYVVEQTGRSRDEVHTFLVNEKILDIPFEIYSNALEAADAAVVDAFTAVSDSQLKKYVLDDYRFLNRRGRIEIAMRIAELTENPRFKLNNPQQDPAGAGESTPASPETDTTPPPNAPETPPEGE